MKYHHHSCLEMEDVEDVENGPIPLLSFFISLLFNFGRTATSAGVAEVPHTKYSSARD